jgi:hypothetical protein
MPLGEIVAEGLFALLRVVLGFVLEFVIELPLRLAGAGVLRVLRIKREFDSTAVLVVGILAWLPVAVGVVWLLTNRP